MNFYDPMLTKIIQSQKDKYCIIPLLWDTHSNHTHRNSRDRKLNGDFQELGGGENWELLFNGYSVSVEGYEKVLQMDGHDGYTII